MNPNVAATPLVVFVDTDDTAAQIHPNEFGDRDVAALRDLAARRGVAPR